tara:strand:+ start:439 stop:822 length:384 start_codon:yes stop_codon:yes gene_type:complete
MCFERVESRFLFIKAQVKDFAKFLREKVSMKYSFECPVKLLIDETSEAYAQYDSVNADYAAFASMALGEFQTALDDPGLTGQTLRRVLRDGNRMHSMRSPMASSWSSFMAKYVSQNVNGNSETGDVC